MGGAAQAILPHHDVAGADVTVYLDVLNEIKQSRPHAGVITVTLAEGETLDTLIEKVGCSKKLREYFRTRPAVGLDDGLGQLRAVGEMAVRKLLADPAFASLLFHILELLLLRHNGYLKTVEVFVVTSTAGGTGSAVSRPAAQALAQRLLDHTNATVCIQILRIGSLSYVTLGDRVHLNSAAAIAEDLAFVLDPDHHAREERRLFLVEAPMVGRRKDQRDAHVAQLIQALRADQVRAVLGVSNPNDSLNSRWGNVSIVRAGWHEALPVRRVASAVAAEYVPQLKQILATGPKADAVEGIEVDLGTERVEPEKSVQAILDWVRRSGQVMPQDFVEMCLRTKGQYTTTTVRARLRDGIANLTDRLCITFSAPCRTGEEYSEKLATMRALDHALAVAIQRRAERINPLRKQADQCRAAVVQATKSLFPRGFVEVLKAQLADPKARLATFKNTVIRGHEVTCELSRLEAEERAIRQVRGQLAEELRIETRRLKRAIDQLSGLQWVREAPGIEPPVTAVVLDAVLDDLLDITAREEPASEDLLALLGSSVQAVTLTGLAQIVGVKEPRAERIAARLAGGNPPIQGPFWGGERPIRRGLAITVLPPLDDRTEEQLRGVLLGLDQDLVPTCADTAQGGVNVLRLEIVKPHRENEIFPPFVLRHLEKVNQQSELFRTNGVLAAMMNTTDQ